MFIIYLYSDNPIYNGIEKYTNYIYKNKMNKSKTEELCNTNSQSSRQEKKDINK